MQAKTSRETVLSVPANQSASIKIPNGEPDADAAASLPEYEVVANSIHDGDTLRVRSSKGEVLKIRFACIDAPELKQPLGQESRNYLRSIIKKGNNKVKLQPITTDRYGRTVAQLWNGNGLIQSQMAIAGMAYGYDQYKKDCPNWSAIESTQAQAQEAKLGVWRLPDGGQRPWDYRKSNRLFVLQNCLSIRVRLQWRLNHEETKNSQNSFNSNRCCLWGSRHN